MISLDNNVSNYESKNVYDKKENNRSKNVTLTDYFKNNYPTSPTPNIDIKMSSTFINTKNKVTLCVSPALVQKAMTDPKAAAMINKGINDMNDIVPFMQTHCLPDGTKAKSISFTLDENGNIVDNVEWEKPEEQKDDKDDKKKIKDKLKKKKLRLDKLKEQNKASNNPYGSSVYNNIYNSVDKKVVDMDM